MGSQCDADVVSRVIKRAIMVQNRANEAILLDCGKHSGDSVGAKQQAAAVEQRGAHHPAKQVVHLDAKVAVRKGRVAVSGKDSGYLAGEMRRGSNIGVALTEPFSNEAEFRGVEGFHSLLDVAEATVKEFGAFGGGTGAEVLGVDERGAEASAGGTEGTAGANGATAKDEHVKRMASSAAEAQEVGVAVVGTPVRVGNGLCWCLCPVALHRLPVLHY